MPPAVDALGVVTGAFNLGVHGVFVGEVPLLYFVHGHAADADGALFAHDGDAALQVVGVGQHRYVDVADGAVAEFETNGDGVFGLDAPAQCGREGENRLDGAAHPLDHIDIVGRLIAQGSAVELPGAPPWSHVVIVLGASPEDIGSDHVEPSEPSCFQGSPQEDDGGVEAVLFDFEVMDARLVAGGDGLVDGLQARPEGFFREHMPSGFGRLNGVFGMEPGRGAEGHEIAIDLLQHFGVVRKGPAASAVGFGRGLGPFGDDVAAGDEVPLPFLFQFFDGGRMAFADAAAADESDANHAMFSLPEIVDVVRRTRRARWSGPASRSRHSTGYAVSL